MQTMRRIVSGRKLRLRLATFLVPNVAIQARSIREIFLKREMRNLSERAQGRPQSLRMSRANRLRRNAASSPGSRLARSVR